MHIANPIGMSALALIPLIVLLHIYRPPAPIRRVGGLFLWRPLADKWQHSSRGRYAMAADITIVILIALLISDIRITENGDRSLSSWALRGLLVCTIWGIWVVRWRRSESS